MAKRNSMRHTWVATGSALFVGAMMVAPDAMAQAVGAGGFGGGALSGGNAGLLAPFLNFATTGFMGGLIQGAVMVVGGTYMFMRGHPTLAAAVGVGALVADNHQAIGALL